MPRHFLINFWITSNGLAFICSVMGTLDSYTHVLPNMQKEAADQLDQLLNSKVK
jgi:hypothetical protein